MDLYKAGWADHYKCRWALLLYPEDETLKSFRRVGLAILWPHRQPLEERYYGHEFKII